MNMKRFLGAIALVLITLVGAGCATQGGGVINKGSGAIDAPPAPTAKPLPEAQAQVLATSAKTGGLDGGTFNFFLYQWRMLNTDGSLGDWLQGHEFVVQSNFEREFMLAVSPGMIVSKIQGRDARKIADTTGCKSDCVDGPVFHVKGGDATASAKGEGYGNSSSSSEIKTKGSKP